MTWLVWRQHRQQALAAAVALLAVALLLVPTGRQMRAAFDDLGLRRCLAGADHSELVAPDGGCASLSEQFSGRFQGLATTSLLLLFLPVVAGMFWGAPLVAREVEHGTHRLVWTQGVTRLRWAMVKLALVGGGVVLVAATYALLVGWWIAPLNAAGCSRNDLRRPATASPGCSSTSRGRCWSATPCSPSPWACSSAP